MKDEKDSHISFTQKIAKKQLNLYETIGSLFIACILIISLVYIPMKKEQNAIQAKADGYESLYKMVKHPPRYKKKNLTGGERYSRIQSILEQLPKKLSMNDRVCIAFAIDNGLNRFNNRMSIDYKPWINIQLILTIMQIESNFQPKVVSSAGAVGLLQIKPSTAKWIAKQCNIDIPRNGAKNIYYNVLTSIAYLRYLSSYFEKQGYSGQFLIIRTVIAYNEGPNSVELKQHIISNLNHNYLKKITKKLVHFNNPSSKSKSLL